MCCAGDFSGFPEGSVKLFIVVCPKKCWDKRREMSSVGPVFASSALFCPPVCPAAPAKGEAPPPAEMCVWKAVFQAWVTGTCCLLLNVCVVSFADLYCSPTGRVLSLTSGEDL